MSQLHAWSAVAVLVTFALLAVVGGAAALAGRGFTVVHWLRAGAIGGAVIAVVAGALAYLAGARPGELLHLVYALALLGILPLGATFAEEAPPAARAGVLGGAAAIGLILAWRLFATG